MNEKCKGCGHRRPLSYILPYPPACHYFLDTGHLRDCPVEDCPHYTTAKFQNNDKWKTLIDKEAENAKIKRL